jgi:UDP-N-acetylglucosamine--N-acetylmuramyl-(pentapeptide) pyrophosphoryl-undecaprenol N-acetylglucosamine transferase
MECQRVPAAGFPLDLVTITGLRGKGLVRWIHMPAQLCTAVWQAFRLMGRNRPACAISFGGYAAGPGGLAAWLRGVPLLVHEQNRIPGLTNRVLARLAKRVLQAFPGTWPQQLHADTCGNPVRREVVGIKAPAERLQDRSGKTRLLITGGSQGALALNRRLPQALALLGESRRPEIRHQAGKGRARETTAAYVAAGVAAQVDEFIEDMAEAYSWADLVVCRSGALTVSELAAAGVGAILVPFPHAVDDHQTRNAGFLVEAGAARLIAEPGCTAKELSLLLASLLGDRSVLLEMAKSARAVATPDSASRVASECMEYLPR